MLRGILNTVPTVLLMFLTVALTLGVVVLAVWVIRRVVPATREGFMAEISAPMLGVPAALFGLLLAFVVVIAYQNSRVELRRQPRSRRPGGDRARQPRVRGTGG